MSHFTNLAQHIPNLGQKQILDLGSGRGKFLVEAAKNGAAVTGLELNPAYIEMSLALAQSQGVSIDIRQGVAEKMPFADSSFDFINMSELIEHVQLPGAMLREVNRVLKLGGLAYMSVPNRFSLRDTHFHLYFVNWLPRSASDKFISLFGRHKDYNDTSAGHQHLADMHYYTFEQINNLVNSYGLVATDIRVLKIRQRFKNNLVRRLALLVYYLLRPWYFDTFHLLLEKKV